MWHNLGKWGKYVAFLFASFNLNLRKISYSKHATGEKRKLDHRQNYQKYGINSPKCAYLPFQFQCILFNFCRLLSRSDGEMLTMKRVPLSISLLCAWLLSSADCSHFRGGSMSWKPTSNASQVLCTDLYQHCRNYDFFFTRLELYCVYVKSYRKIIQFLWKGGGGIRGDFLLLLNDERLAEGF